MHVRVEPAKLHKHCSCCNELKAIDDFYKSKRWHRNVCKPCYDARRTPAQRILKDAKYRAKIKNLDFNLELSDIVIPQFCPVFGTPLIAKNRDDCPSIDRIDNSKGYTKDNIIIISMKANKFKNAATIEELKQIVRFYDNLNSHK